MPPWSWRCAQVTASGPRHRLAVGTRGRGLAEHSAEELAEHAERGGLRCCRHLAGELGERVGRGRGQQVAVEGREVAGQAGRVVGLEHVADRASVGAGGTRHAGAVERQAGQHQIDAGRIVDRHGAEERRRRLHAGERAGRGGEADDAAVSRRVGVEGGLDDGAQRAAQGRRAATGRAEHGQAVERARRRAAADAKRQCGVRLVGEHAVDGVEHAAGLRQRRADGDQAAVGQAVAAGGAEADRAVERAGIGHEVVAAGGRHRAAQPGAQRRAGNRAGIGQRVAAAERHAGRGAARGGDAAGIDDRRAAAGRGVDAPGARADVDRAEIGDVRGAERAAEDAYAVVAHGDRAVVHRPVAGADGAHSEPELADVDGAVVDGRPVDSDDVDTHRAGVDRAVVDDRAVGAEQLDAEPVGDRHRAVVGDNGVAGARLDPDTDAAGSQADRAVVGDDAVAVVDLDANRGVGRADQSAVGNGDAVARHADAGAERSDRDRALVGDSCLVALDVDCPYCCRRR